MTPPDAAPPCPYVGLQPFREADREFFFGRDRDQRIICANLLSSPLTILYGGSGVGKSSLLMAGVIPYLRREHRRTPVVVFRDWAGEDFQVSLTRACIAAVWKDDPKGPKPAEHLPLDEILRACVEAAHDTILVLFDQFEEYFLYHPKSSDPTSFEAQFARAVNREDVDVGFLIALREDSLSKLDRFRERIPNLLSNRLILKHLDEAGAALAIRLPLEVWNRKYAGGEPPITIEDGLVAELIDQVRIGRVTVSRHGGSGGSREDEQFVEAPFLQLVITRLWAEEADAGSRTLRLATLERLGGAEEIVRKHLDDVMERLDGLSQAVCARFFDRLVTPTGSKVACSRDDLARWANSLAPKVPEVLEVLSGNRILRTVAQSAEKPGAISYEIYHDVLAPAVLSWRTRYIGEQQRAELEQRAREAEARALEKEQNNRRLILWQRCLLVAVILSLFAAGYAVYQQYLANEGKQRAMAFAAISASYSNRERPELSTLLALQAALLAKSITASNALPGAENALRRALSQPLKWSRYHGKDEKVGAVAYSPDGRLVATAGGKRLHLWDASMGAERTPKPMEHSDVVTEIAFTADGKRLLAGDAGGHLRWWDIETGDEKTPAAPMKHGASISAMALGPANLLATGSLRNGAVVLWNLANGARIGDLPSGPGEERWVAGLAFNGDGSRLAVGEVKAGATTVWDVSNIQDVASAAPIVTLRYWMLGPDGTPDPKKKMLVDAVAFSPDGRRLATGDRDNTVNLWDAATGVHLDTFWGHTGQVRKLAFSPDGSRLATASADKTARIWETASGRSLLSLGGHTLSVDELAFGPDGKHLLTGSQDRQAKWWNVATHADAVVAVAFHPDGKLLATGSADDTIKVWEVRSRELVKTLVGHQGRVQELAFSPDGKFLASASFDETARIWNLATGQEALPPLQYEDKEHHYDKVYDVAYSPDGRWLATAGANHNAVVWDAATGSILFVRRHGGEVSAVAFSPDGKYLASAGWDGRVNIWDIPSGDPAASICSPNKRKLLDVNFSPRGERLVMATGTPDVLVVYGWPRHVMALPDSRPRGQAACKDAATLLPGQDPPVAERAQFTPDGRYVVTVGMDREVKIREFATGKEVRSVRVHRGKVNDVAFDRDGNWIATASEDGTFHVSPLNSEELLNLGCARVSRPLENEECREHLGVDECPPHPCLGVPGAETVVSEVPPPR